MKTCSKCHVKKELSEFHNDPRMLDGHKNHCKKCRNAALAKYHKKNRETNKARYRAWYVDHTEYAKAEAKAHYDKNKEAIKAKRKQRYHKAKLRAIQGQPRCKHGLLSGQCSLCAGIPPRGRIWANLGDGVDREFELFV